MKIVIQLKTGELVICETSDVEPFDDTNIITLEVKNPAVIMPMPPGADGKQTGQIGFHKFFPFSDSDEKQEIRKSHIVTLSKPLDGFVKAYEEWRTQVRASEAGLIVP